MTSDPSSTSANSQAVRRAISVLRSLATGLSGGVSLRDVARATDLPRPTVHRILKALVEEGVVEQNGRTRRYAIGEQIPLLALARPRRSALLQAADPVLDRAADEIGDTVFLTIRTGNDTVCVARRIGSYPIQVLVIEVGARRPLGVSSAGLAILSCLAEDQARDLIVRNAHRLPDYQTDRQRAGEQLAAARRRGYALKDPGLVPGTKAMSVGIEADGGETLAALTVTAVSRRLRAQREAELFGELVAYRAAILERLRILQPAAAIREPS